MNKIQLDMIARAIAATVVLVVQLGFCGYVAGQSGVFNVIPAIIFITLIGCGIIYMIYTPPQKYDTEDWYD